MEKQKQKGKVDSCYNGHPYTPENTYTRQNGTKECRTCRRQVMARRRALKKKAAAALFLIAIATTASAQHGTWHDKYISPSGSNCCGTRDCVVVKARVLLQTKNTVTAEVNGAIMTLNSKALFISEDNKDWSCFYFTDGKPQIRCLFIAPGT